MEEKERMIRLLLVDDEEDFRAATITVLKRRGFEVREAENGEEGLKAIRSDRPDLAILDLKMPGINGIETLQKIREFEPVLPVIILTGHGSYHDALAGINLEIVDFIQKPVDMNILESRIRRFLIKGNDKPLRERTISELMISPSVYPHLYIDQPVREVMEVLYKSFFTKGEGRLQMPQFRSALVYDRNERFYGLIRFVDLLKLVIPAFLDDSPYTTYFTGMYLAQCKVIGEKSMAELMGDFVSIQVDAPLMEAVSIMTRYRVINIPVLKDDELVGILREKDIILDIARNIGVAG